MSGDLEIEDFDAHYVFYQVGLFQGRDDGLFATSRELTLDCLEELHRPVSADGAELLIAFLPSLIQLDNGHLRQYLARYSVELDDMEALDRTYPTSIVRDFCISRQVPFLDLSAH